MPGFEGAERQDHHECEAGVETSRRPQAERREVRVLIGKKASWWNRPLKGRWMLGSLIGFAVSVLIASQIARWLVVMLIVLGGLFAIAFRLARKNDEI